MRVEPPADRVAPFRAPVSRQRQVNRSGGCQPRSDHQFHQGKVLRSKVGLSDGEALLDVAPGASAGLDLASHGAQAFDVVLWNGALQVAPDKLAALEQTRRILRNGGRVGVAATAREREHGFDRALRVVLTRIGAAHAVRRASGARHGVATDEVLAWLWEAGFVDIALQIRTFGDSFADADEVIRHHLGGDRGTAFVELDRALRERVKRELRAELELQRTPQGIRVERHVIFAVGRA